MIKEEYKYSETTGKMIGCAMKVHQRMRNGYQELIYHHQALNYLEGLNLEIGLLLNFGSKSLDIKRIINNKVRESV